MRSAAPRRSWVANGPVRLPVAEVGPEAAVPIIALHGFPESAATWEPVAQILADRYRTVTPDLRGFGDSDAPRWVRSYQMEKLLDDVEAVIDHTGHTPARLVGHDWGGALVWLLAERRPHLVDRAVVINAPHPAVLWRAIWGDSHQRKRSGYVLALQIPWLPERRLARDGGERLARLFPPDHYDRPTVERYREQWIRPGRFRAMLAWYRASARDRSLWRAPGSVAVPMTVIWGTADPLFTTTVRDDSIALADSPTVHLLDDCGHAPHRERPEQVAALISQSLDS